jgi:hypothetical protein
MTKLMRLSISQQTPQSALYTFAAQAIALYAEQLICSAKVLPFLPLVFPKVFLQPNVKTIGFSKKQTQFTGSSLRWERQYEGQNYQRERKIVSLTGQ